MIASRLLPLFALACLLPVNAQDGTQERAQPAAGGLAWQLKAGDRLPYTLTFLLEETTELKGLMPPQQVVTEVAYGATHEVKSVNGDVATIEVTVESIRARMGMGMMGEMAYDSKQDDTLNPLRGIRHAVGKKFTYQLSRTGKVSQVTGGDAAVEEINEAMSGEAPPPSNDQGGGMGGMMGFDPAAIAAQACQQMAKVLFADKALASILELVNGILPEDPAAKTWTRAVDMNLPGAGTLKFNSDQTNAGEADGNVRITSAVKDLEFERDLTNGQGGPMAEQMKQMMGESTVTRKDARGSGTFSASKGRLIDSELVVELDSEGDLPPFIKAMMQQQGGGQLPQDVKMSRNTAVTLRYVLEGSPAGGAEAPKTPGSGEKF